MGTKGGEPEKWPRIKTKKNPSKTRGKPLKRKTLPQTTITTPKRAQAPKKITQAKISTLKQMAPNSFVVGGRFVAGKEDFENLT